MNLLHDKEGEASPLMWMLRLLGCAIALFAVLLVFIGTCAKMDSEAAKNPLYRMPGWVQDCAKQRPLADCERDWQTLKERAAP